MKRTILLSAIFALLAVAISYMYFSGLEIKYRNMGDTAQVVVADRVIVQGTLITRDMLTTIEVPKAYIQPKTFSSIRDLFSSDGKAIYAALATIEANEQILPGKISDTSREIGISYIIPDGYKALAVSFDSDSADIILPGNRVDILASIQYSDSKGKVQESVYIIAQNILVLGVGSDYFGDRRAQPNANNALGGSPQDTANNHVITLSVSAQEAQTIFISQEHGALKYIIRPVGDNAIYDAKVVKISDIVADIDLTKPVIKGNVGGQNQAEIMKLINQYSTPNQ
ncbi:MAG: Flp pilus assembly protein CpaB [Elusimicrobiota bacterium]|jgi:Flp pilus assembly protein CpaB|nr:Flp pilus assembly protein CpaB [Elusimicrobiota bacterium]